MSDRLLNLFIKEVKKANDGLMPKDLVVTVWTGAERFEGTLARVDDSAGVMILENKVDLVTMDKKSLKTTGSFKREHRIFIRIADIKALHVFKDVT